MSDISNSSLVVPPTAAATKIVLSTASAGVLGTISGEGWYSFRAVGCTAYIVLLTVSTASMPAASVAWEIPAGQREDYLVPPQIRYVKAFGSATGGKLKYRRS